MNRAMPTRVIPAPPSALAVLPAATGAAVWWAANTPASVGTLLVGAGIAAGIWLHAFYGAHRMLASGTDPAYVWREAALLAQGATLFSLLGGAVAAGSALYVFTADPNPLTTSAPIPLAACLTPIVVGASLGMGAAHRTATRNALTENG